MGLAFDGVDQDVVFSSWTPPASTVAFSFWVIPRAFPGTIRIFGSATHMEVRFNGSGQMFNDIYEDPGGGASATTFSIGQLYHVVAQGDAVADVNELFVDGVLDLTNSSATQGTIGTALHIGSRVGVGFANVDFFDFRVYGRELTPAEVSTIHAARGGDGIVDGLLNRWLMNEGAPGAAASGAGSIVDQLGADSGTPNNSPVYTAEAGINGLRRRAA